VIILDRIVEDNPTVTDLILWSDSCVPQNRNKVMSTALKLFLESHPLVETITQKYCEPGHSEVQEVDNLHSILERVMAPNEVYSPVGLMRILCASPRNKPMKIVQLRKRDFKDYHSIADNFKFDVVPYSRVKSLNYARDALMKIKYKLKFDNETWDDVSIQPICRTRAQQEESKNKKVLTMPTKLTKVQKLSAEKLADIRSMFPFMPEIGRLCMQSMIKNAEEIDPVTTVSTHSVTTVSTHKKNTRAKGPHTKTAPKKKAHRTK